MLLADAMASSVVIGGPTAIGKTAVSLALARLSPGKFEVVSADSVQVYRRLDIGSAKPSAMERAEVPMHLVDVADPDENFTLVDYQQQAQAAIKEITKRGRIPLIVGGAGLYIRSITQGLGIPIAGPDESLRALLTQEASALGTKVLHDRLTVVDPLSAARIHQNDLKRIIRGLEVFILTGRPLSVWHQEDALRNKPLPLKYFALDRDRDRLYDQIDERCDKMFNGGIVEEVAALRAEGYGRDLKPMSSVGYLQANQVVDGEISTSQAVELAKNATHQYARRQLIWFRGDQGVTWINTEDHAPESIARNIAAQIETQG